MAISKPLRLTVSLASRKLVAYLGTPTAIGDLFQADLLSLEIQFVDETGNFNAPYSVVNMNGLSLRVSVGSTPTGTAGGPPPLALQTSFTWDNTRKLFTGDLALNTSGIDGLIGAQPQATAYFEIKLASGTDRLTLLQSTFTVRAVVDEGSSTVPTPTDQYPTKNEADARYLLQSANTALYLTNPTTGKTMIVYLGDDNSFKAELIN